jgi:phenylpropionate dioxygenase-like ring-hydroxylating dioxygenase large terminal subunit
MVWSTIFLLLSLSIAYGFLGPRNFMYSKKIQSPMMKLSENNMDKELVDYSTSWYVVGETKEIRTNKLYKAKIWDEDYVFWKNEGTYYAMDDDCSHRGASLSDGHLCDNQVICPYHAYEFDKKGILVKIPGLNFTNTPCKNQKTYAIMEKNGWVYINTKMTPMDILRFPRETQFLFEEPEGHDENFSSVLFHTPFKAYGRVVSENSLDVMHIAYVHTFGNKQHPSPIREDPPYSVGDYPNHYRTKYDYIAGSDSIAKKMYSTKTLQIENEFVMPHTTVARVLFDEKISTIITFATPHNNTHTTLYVKTYRNFWYDNQGTLLSMATNYIGDMITTSMMKNTVNQDKSVVEGIYFDKKDGKFNMKYDKLQSVYKKKYKQLVEENEK